MVDHVEAVAAEEGLLFRLGEAQRVNTVDAHRLLHLALETAGRRCSPRSRRSCSRRTSCGRRTSPTTTCCVVRRRRWVSTPTASTRCSRHRRVRRRGRGRHPRGGRPRRDRSAVLRDRPQVRRLRRASRPRPSPRCSSAPGPRRTRRSSTSATTTGRPAARTAARSEAAAIHRQQAHPVDVGPDLWTTARLLWTTRRSREFLEIVGETPLRRPVASGVEISHALPSGRAGSLGEEGPQSGETRSRCAGDGSRDRTRRVVDRKVTVLRSPEGPSNSYLLGPSPISQPVPQGRAHRRDPRARLPRALRSATLGAAQRRAGNLHLTCRIVVTPSSDAGPSYSSPKSSAPRPSRRSVPTSRSATATAPTGPSCSPRSSTSTRCWCARPPRSTRRPCSPPSASRSWPGPVSASTTSTSGRPRRTA